MKICFNGCSFTEGVGFKPPDRLKSVYPWIVGNTLNCEVTNIAVAGSSNYQIFLRSADAIMSSDFDIVITQWSALNRLWLYPGPDASLFVNDRENQEFKYRDIFLSKSQKKYLQDVILYLNHDFKNILDLIDYCKILAALKKEKPGVIFINGLVPWTNDLTKKPTEDLSGFLSDYTKAILDFDNRDDKEIVNFFNQLQTKFQTLDQSLWVNLFESIQKHQIDQAPLDTHPGPLTHKVIATKITKYITTKFL